jgi:RNA polymerase sigma factor (TIGR02999 family)
MLSALYRELRTLARARLRQERAGISLASAELVHEAYLRLSSEGRPGWANRAHFFAAAAEAMRRILVERARARGREKRGGHEGQPPRRVSLSDLDAADLGVDYDLDEILALDRAIERLQDVDARAASVVRLRFYAGLSIDEAAEVLGVTSRTVKRDWTFARAWLFGALGEAPPPA